MKVIVEFCSAQQGTFFMVDEREQTDESLNKLLVVAEYSPTADPTNEDSRCVCGVCVCVRVCVKVYV